MLFEPCSSLNLKYITYEGHDPTSLELTCSAWTHSLRSFQRCSVGRVCPPPDYNGIIWMWINGRVFPPYDDKWVAWIWINGRVRPPSPPSDDDVALADSF